MSAAALRWSWLRFGELGVERLYALLRLRCEVFVVEQACPYLDPDGKDVRADTLHVLGEDADRQLLAYLRVIAPGVSFAEPSLGRVVTAPAARRRGLGGPLIEQGLAALARHWPGQPVRIGAQAYLIDFYARHGFVVDSAPYDEDGIPHVEMRRAAGSYG